MDAEQAAKLRAPFPAAAIGKLPKPYKKDSPKGNCKECGGYHGLPAVHLDYVGHAATTDRLLQVDPEWTWEPAAVGPNGEPLIVNGGLWIKLTVAGVTRYGFGDAPTGSMKECIGDAIRNAAMRFGVALDLWAKEDLHAESDDKPVGGDAVAPTQTAETPAPAEAALTARLLELAGRWGELKPDTTAEEVVKTTNLALAKQRSSGKKAATVEWLERQVKALEANIASAEAEAASPYQKPKDKAA